MDIDYKVIYSAKRKTLGIAVERDRSIVVRAPQGTDPETIRQVVESRKLWIYEKLRYSQKYNGLPHPPGKEIVNGESVLYLGREYRIHLIEGDGPIELTDLILVPRNLENQKTTAFQEWYKQQAQAVILPRVEVCAKQLGVTYKNAKIIDSKYRWGSCTPKDNVNFNWRLVKAPMFVIDYVIVHELAHLLEPNHTPRFWNIIRAHIVNMDKAKSWLKNNGDLLELDI